MSLQNETNRHDFLIRDCEESDIAIHVLKIDIAKNNRQQKDLEEKMQRVLAGSVSTVRFSH